MNQDKAKEQEKRLRISTYYKAQTPVYIIKDDDAWISGYIDSEPSNDLYFYVLDWRQNEPVKIHYIDFNLHNLKEFRGSAAKLPLPQYMRGTQGEEPSAVKADRNVPSNSHKSGEASH